MDQQALLSHLLTRLHADIDFLASQHLISQQDASEIKSKLPAAQAAPSQGLAALSLNASPAATVQRSVPPPPGAVAPSLPAQHEQQRTCRAVWDYAQTQPDDLAFTKGQVITIVEEENADWWRGSLDGRTGIFPSNHVERIDSPVPAPSRSPAPAPPSAYPSSTASTLYPNSTGTSSYSAHSSNAFVPPPPSQQPQYPYQQPQPYAAQHQPSFAGSSYLQQQPSGGVGQWDEKKNQQQQSYGGYQPPPTPPAHQQAVQPQQPPEIPEKKNKHKFAGRMGTAFAGGVGFGTGSAIASNAINAIF